MSLYVNNAAEQPNSIYYNGNELNTVYFNGDLVWEKVVGWQEIINTIEKKANGEISKWPSEYSVGSRFTIPLGDTSTYWGNEITIMVSQQKTNSLVFSVVGDWSYWYEPADIANYEGWRNSLPRRYCQELYELLPFKDKLIPHTIRWLDVITNCGGYNPDTQLLSIKGMTANSNVIDYVVIPEPGEWLGYSQFSLYCDEMNARFRYHTGPWIRPMDQDNGGVYRSRSYGRSGSYFDNVIWGMTDGNFTYSRNPVEAFFEIGA